MGTADPFSGGKAAGELRLTTHFQCWGSEWVELYLQYLPVCKPSWPVRGKLYPSTSM